MGLYNAFLSSKLLKNTEIKCSHLLIKTDLKANFKSVYIFMVFCYDDLTGHILTELFT